MGRPRGASLKQRDIVQAGVECANERGEATVSIQCVADRLGIRPPSLYNHVDNQEHLRRLVAIEGWKSLTAAFERARRRSESPIGELRAIASAYRRFAKRHQGLYELTFAVPMSPNDTDFAAAAQSALASMLETYERIGVDRAEALDHLRAFRAALHGFVVLEQGGQFRMSFSVAQTFEYLVDTMLAPIVASKAAQQAKKKKKSKG